MIIIKNYDEQYRQTMKNERNEVFDDKMTEQKQYGEKLNTRNITYLWKLLIWRKL